MGVEMDFVYGPYDPYGENSSCKATRISFGIRGQEFNPDEFSERTGLKPSRAQTRGQRIQDSRGGTHIAGEGSWKIRSDKAVASTSAELHAQYILEQLEPHAHIIDQFLNRPGYSTVISIWWETDIGIGGFSLRATTLARLGRLCDRFDTHFIGGVYPEGNKEDGPGQEENP